MKENKDFFYRNVCLKTGGCWLRVLYDARIVFHFSSRGIFTLFVITLKDI
jgi:hypothetical protein